MGNTDMNSASSGGHLAVLIESDSGDKIVMPQLYYAGDDTVVEYCDSSCPVVTLASDNENGWVGKVEWSQAGLSLNGQTDFGFVCKSNCSLGTYSNNAMDMTPVVAVGGATPGFQTAARYVCLYGQPCVLESSKCVEVCDPVVTLGRTYGNHPRETTISGEYGYLGIDSISGSPYYSSNFKSYDNTMYLYDRYGRDGYSYHMWAVCSTLFDTNSACYAHANGYTTPQSAYAWSVTDSSGNWYLQSASSFSAYCTEPVPTAPPTPKPTDIFSSINPYGAAAVGLWAAGSLAASVFLSATEDTEDDPDDDHHKND